MKLLFDANLSYHLIERLNDIFPNSIHVRQVHLHRENDSVIWQFARDQNYMIVTKDSDFYERGIIEGQPPKIVWIRRGNCSTKIIEELLQAHSHEIKSLEFEDETSCLILY